MIISADARQPEDPAIALLGSTHVSAPHPAFSRYENGKTKPPLALVKLLKVLERHPDLLGEVRAA